jgi:hypothetical protein
MKRQRNPQKAYWEMTAKELAEATKEFDKPLPPERFKPLSKEERARFERARRAGGLRINRIYGLGLDDKLLDEAVAYARRKKMTVSQVIERGVRGLLAFGD